MNNDTIPKANHKQVITKEVEGFETDKKNTSFSLFNYSKFYTHGSLESCFFVPILSFVITVY